MKNLKKILAVVLAMVLMAAMSVTMFADETMTGEKGVIGEFTQPDTPVAKDSTVLLYKQITAYNPAGSTVNAPAMEYTYTIASGSAGKTVKDAGGTALHASGTAVVAYTKAGLPGATISGSVDGTNFTAGKLTLTNDVQLNTSAAGTANRFALKLDFSGVRWTGAGIYRYVITETTAEGAKAAASIIDGGIADKIYLDVYVKDAAAAGTYEIYGYVCLNADVDIDGTATTDPENKTEGFVPGDPNDPDETADEYYTYDLTVSKTVVNDQAMVNHEFPFSVTFTPATGVTAANFKLKTSGATIGTGYAGALTSDSPKIKSGSNVKYIGIPYGTSVTINETNDVAGTTYKVTSTGADTNINQSLTGTSAGAVSNNAVVSAQTTANLATKTVAVTNTLETISPTGVILRIAPFAIILLAGIALFVVARRRRVED